MSYLDRAQEIKDELVAHRRHLHQNPEVGVDLPNTTAYVMQELTKLGYEPKEIAPCGVVATVGKGGKCFLIRSDMDALPMDEMSGLPFASTNGAAHCCGHDLHTSILLGAAKLLKENEDKLEGTVKLMFQPGEEIFKGAESMIKAGLMENPKVDAAFAMHVVTTHEAGTALFLPGPCMASCFGFKIKITGKGCHGAQPQTGVDPINIGVHIHLALQELIAREVSFMKGAFLTIGSFNAGAAANIIPHTAELQGTMRSFDEEVRNFLMGRIKEVVTKTAELYRGEAEIETLSNVPVTFNNEAFTETLMGYTQDLLGGKHEVIVGGGMTASEDFSLIGEMVPASMANLGASDLNAGKEIQALHHPKILFDERAIPVGSAIYAEMATRWLQDNK